MDKKIRSFVWGSTQEQRKIHLISWDSICRPKDQGGLGLRSARELNKAYILKVAWGLMKRPEELWARVLISKYLKQSTNGLVERGTKRITALWRGIKDSWELLSLGSRWSIRDGKETKFWTDSWLDSGIVLAAHARVSALISDDIMVADICDDAGKWNVSFLNENMSANVVEQVLGMTPPSAELGNDKLVRGLEPNGMFSIQSAYILIKQLNDVDTGKLWRKVWTWQGPNKICHFLWLASHGRLLTNVERRRRHLTNNAACAICGNHEESVDHILRKCPFAATVWRDFIPTSHQQEFFSQNFENWWYDQISHSDKSLVDWEVRLKHVYREANVLADYIANIGHTLTIGNYEVGVRGNLMRHWMEHDILGVAQTRAIIM
ncbi:Putative ribonuclease H protein At1g65750 [Linum grandiflorum]